MWKKISTNKQEQLFSADIALNLKPINFLLKIKREMLIRIL